MPEPKVYVFWDNSNIFISAKYVATRREGPNAEYDVRIHFDNLFKLAKANRQLVKALVVGSIPPELRSVWDKVKEIGVEVELYERGKETGKEQGLDQCIQVHMLRALADSREPQIVVLLTGDGKGYDDGVGFHADLERMKNQGWGIEVLAWDISCKRTLKIWANNVGRFIPLEDYYKSVTFLEGLRLAQPLNLTHRPKATPRYLSEESLTVATPILKTQNNRKSKEQREIDERRTKELKRQSEANERNKKDPKHARKRRRQAKKRKKKKKRK